MFLVLVSRFVDERTSLLPPCGSSSTKMRPLGRFALVSSLQVPFEPSAKNCPLPPKQFQSVIIFHRIFKDTLKILSQKHNVILKEKRPKMKCSWLGIIFCRYFRWSKNLLADRLMCSSNDFRAGAAADFVTISRTSGREINWPHVPPVVQTVNWKCL